MRSVGVPETSRQARIFLRFDNGSLVEIKQICISSFRVENNLSGRKHFRAPESPRMRNRYQAGNGKFLQVFGFSVNCPVCTGINYDCIIRVCFGKLHCAERAIALKREIGARRSGNFLDRECLVFRRAEENTVSAERNRRQRRASVIGGNLSGNRSRADERRSAFEGENAVRAVCHPIRSSTGNVKYPAGSLNRAVKCRVCIIYVKFAGDVERSRAGKRFRERVHAVNRIRQFRASGKFQCCVGSDFHFRLRCRCKQHHIAFGDGNFSVERQILHFAAKDKLHESFHDHERSRAGFFNRSRRAVSRADSVKIRANRVFRSRYVKRQSRIIEHDGRSIFITVSCAFEFECAALDIERSRAAEDGNFFIRADRECCPVRQVERCGNAFSDVERVCSRRRVFGNREACTVAERDIARRERRGVNFYVVRVDVKRAKHSGVVNLREFTEIDRVAGERDVRSGKRGFRRSRGADAVDFERAVSGVFNRRATSRAERNPGGKFACVYAVKAQLRRRVFRNRVIF